jgi:hypothetical protein
MVQLPVGVRDPNFGSHKTETMVQEVIHERGRR